MEPKWKRFERLVAAIHKLTHEGATITWNDVIDGRQFDVTLRFQFGLYTYLTVIECRDYNSPVPVGDIDAFVPKSRDVGAHKAIMITTSGFQEGAFTVAKRHGIELCTLEEVDAVPEHFIVKGLTPAVNILGIELLSRQGKTLRCLSDESNIMGYYVNATIFYFGSHQSTLKSLLDKWQVKTVEVVDDQDKEFFMQLPRNTKVRYPHEDHNIAVDRVRFTAKIFTCQIVNAGGLDPYIIPGDWAMTNLTTRETRRFDSRIIRRGFGNSFEVGEFYVNPNLGFNYFCEKIHEEEITLVLVESYQHGTIIQARITLGIDQADHFLPIKDGEEIKRLQKIYKRYLAR